MQSKDNAIKKDGVIGRKMSILKELEELQKKAELYNVLKGNIDKAQKDIEESIDKMNSALKMLNPLKDSIPRRYNKQGNNAHIYEEQFNKMKMGVYVNSDTLKKDYPEFEDRKIHNILYAMKTNMSHVQSTKIGGRTNLFLHNTP